MNRDLAILLEDNLRTGNQELVSTWNASQPTEKAASLEFDKAIAVYCGPESPVNDTVGLGMASPVTDQMMEQIEDFYESHDSVMTLRICPFAHSSLLQQVHNRGYKLVSFCSRWVLDLSSWRSPLAEPDGRIHAATADEEIAWARTIFCGFEDMDEMRVGDADDCMQLEKSFFRGRSTVPVIGVENGVPASGGVLALDGDVAALFTASTLPSYRRRGLQTAILDWRLRFAKEHGARIATIETDPGTASQRNVERMGFQLAYMTSQVEKVF